MSLDTLSKGQELRIHTVCGNSSSARCSGDDTYSHSDARNNSRFHNASVEVISLGVKGQGDKYVNNI